MRLCWFPSLHCHTKLFSTCSQFFFQICDPLCTVTVCVLCFAQLPDEFAQHLQFVNHVVLKILRFFAIVVCSGLYVSDLHLQTSNGVDWIADIFTA